MAVEALMGPHWEFISASYAATILVVGGLIAWVLVDGREQRQLLDLVERRGSRAERGDAGTQSGGPRGDGS